MFTVVGHEQVDGINQADSVGNLTAALESVVPILEDAGKTLILEPFNPVDHVGFFLNGSPDALKICREIDSPFVKINWDLYHMQLTEGKSRREYARRHRSDRFSCRLRMCLDASNREQVS